MTLNKCQAQVKEAADSGRDVVFVGHWGAGKSTVLHLLATTYAGQVLVMRTLPWPHEREHPVHDMATATPEQVAAAPAGSLVVVDDAHYITDWRPIEATAARVVLACLPTPAADVACRVIASRGGVQVVSAPPAYQTDWLDQPEVDL